MRFAAEVEDNGPREDINDLLVDRDAFAVLGLRFIIKQGALHTFDL
jgi:hypothetical protein